MENIQKVQKEKRVAIGDGKLFKDAAAASNDSKETIRKKMIKPNGRAISNGTFFDLYYKNEFDPTEKAAAAIALGKTVEEIFGMPKPKIIHPRREALPLGGYGDDDAIEYTKGGNQYIDLGGGSYVMITKIVEERAWGGYLHGYKDPEYVESLPVHGITVNQIPRGKYTSFEMVGYSMDDGEERAIKPGDIVTGRYVDPMLYVHSKLHLKTYKEWVIVHIDGIVVKEITAHDVEKGIIYIHSYNPDKNEFPDDYFFLKDVRELHNIIKVTKDRK